MFAVYEHFVIKFHAAPRVDPVADLGGYSVSYRWAGCWWFRHQRLSSHVNPVIKVEETPYLGEHQAQILSNGLQ